MSRKPSITLLFDPLCGWCYGAAASMQALAQALDLDWSILPSGLFASPSAMTKERAAMYWGYDQRIAAVSKQVFSAAYQNNILGDVQTPFDSTPATHAFLLIARAKPEYRLAALHRLQIMRYVDGMQHTNAAIAKVAGEFGFDPMQFQAQMEQPWKPSDQPEIQQARSLMNQYGVNGVPALIWQNDIVPTEYLYNAEQLIGLIKEGCRS